MKKLLSIIMILFLSISICACGYNSPEIEVTRVLDAFQKYDQDVLMDYVEDENMKLFVNLQGDEKVVNTMYKALFKNMTYTIESSENKDDYTIVKVNVENKDFGKVFKDYSSSSYAYVIDNMYSGKLNKKKLNAKCLQLFSDSIEKASKEKKTVKKEIELKMKKNENGYYRIEFDGNDLDGITGGLFKSLKKVL